MHSEITCREMLTFLAEYLSGALPQVQREAFDGHLSRCPECVAYVNNRPRVTLLVPEDPIR